MSTTAPDPRSPRQACWIRPDGTVLPAPDGLGAPIGDPSVPDSDTALVLGWIGIRPLPDEGGWEILPLVAGPTRRAHAVASKLVRPARAATPKPLSNALLRLALCAWDSDRYPDPAAALARKGDGRAWDRLLAAIEAAAERAPDGRLEPDLDGIAAALGRLSTGLDGLYEAAHGWRYGPSLEPGPGGRRSEDPDVIRAGTEAAAARILDAAGRMEQAIDDARIAVYGLPPGSVPKGVPPAPRPGESALAALVRHEDEVENEQRRRRAARDASEHPCDRLPEPVRAPARVWLDAMNGTRAQVSGLREAAETFLTLAARLEPGDASRRQDLAGGLLAHECGRRALELRGRIRRTLPAYLDRLREAAGSAFAPGGRP